MPKFPTFQSMRDMPTIEAAARLPSAAAPWSAEPARETGRNHASRDFERWTGSDQADCFREKSTCGLDACANAHHRESSSRVEPARLIPHVAHFGIGQYSPVGRADLDAKLRGDIVYHSPRQPPPGMGAGATHCAGMMVTD